jgi:hypothetical protein
VRTGQQHSSADHQTTRASTSKRPRTSPTASHWLLKPVRKRGTNKGTFVSSSSAFFLVRGKAKNAFAPKIVCVDASPAFSPPPKD